jgi:carbon starvation protein
LLAKLLKLDPKARTPSYELQDDVDYVPTESKLLLSQHFSAIAAAGPIVGPIVAGKLFGWLPALLWILVGSILIGGVHDITSLVASIRHKARSIAEVVREHMSRRSYMLFLSFIWIALVYIIVAFTDVTAQSFVRTQVLDNGDKVSGGAIATSSLLYLILPIAMALVMKYGKLSLNWATLIFVLLIGGAIYAGGYFPFDLGKVIGLKEGDTITAQKTWDVLLLIYCVVAAMVPVWLLLQPRGHLGGYFLYIALAAGLFGILFSGKPIQYPAFIGFEVASPKGTLSLFPVLFITIACGACSGFHSLIASGTTSKQLKYETDAKPIGYGTMLLEAMVSIISLSCVMILSQYSALIKNGTGPSGIYAAGIGSYVEMLGINPQLAASFALMAFTTFVFDTLDVCTRLGRFIIQELIGRHDFAGRFIGTILTAGVPIYFLLQDYHDATGKRVDIWFQFWDLFGASNQLLAALTLLGVTVWLWRTQHAKWVWFVTGIPCVWMYTMSMWALIYMTRAKFFTTDNNFQLSKDPVAWAGLVLIILAVLMFIEAVIVLLGDRNRRGGSEIRVLGAEAGAV